MKIGYLVQDLDRKTGGGRFAADIIDGVKAQGHEVVVLEEGSRGVKGHSILGRGFKIFTCIPEVRRLLKDCDVIHAIDGYPYGIIGWLANRKLKKKLIISALGTYAVAPLYRWQTSFLLKEAYRNAHRIVAISKVTKSKILEKIALDNVTVVHPGIRLKEEISEKTATVGRFILGVGALKERKGYHISLAAFAKISTEFSDLKYVIVADPDRAYKTILDKFIKESHLENKVEFLNFIPEEKLLKLYASASIFVLTPINTLDNHFEGFGLVYLEAAQFGLPVIGTLGTGAEDAINADKNGILVHQKNIDETADAIKKILLDNNARESMKRESLAWAKANTVSIEMGKIIEVYKS